MGQCEQHLRLFVVLVVSTSLLSLPGFVHSTRASEVEPRLAGRSLAEKCKLAVTTSPAGPAYLKRLIAEPFKVTTFGVSYTCANGTQFAIKVEGGQGEYGFGNSVPLTFKKLGFARIRVFVCPATLAHVGAKHWCEVKATLVGKVGVTVVYVRREIRSMSPADRQDYFDAIKIIGNTSTAAGRKKYGPFFYNYYELVARHASFLYTQKCDLAHLGPAFMIAHRAFVNEFEKVVQSVKRHVAAPYWNYFNDGDLKDPTKSELWTNAYYGKLFNDPADDYIVKDGQFAYWRVPSGAEAKKLASMTWGKLGPSRTVNPWGFFRGAENMNKAKYLTRIGPGPFIFGVPTALPRTVDWLGCKNYTTFGEFAKCVDLNIHGGPHAWTSGNVGLPTFEEKKGELDCSQLDKFGPTVCKDTFSSFSFLGLFGRGIFRVEDCLLCNKTCTLDKSVAECNCQCSAERPRCAPENMIKRVFNKVFYGAVELGTSPVPPFVFEFGAVFGKYGTFSLPSADKTQYPDFMSSTNILNSTTLHAGVFPPGNSNPSGICYGHGLYDKTCLGAFSGTFRSVPKAKQMTNLDVLETVDVQLNRPEHANYVYDTLQKAQASAVAK
eukprot:jgi/Mesen1/3314/ME000191S02451